MNCPPELATEVLELITSGLLRIRRMGEQGMAGRCAIEADHIHNLPALLKDYSVDLLRFYWDTERTSYITQSSSDDLAHFEAIWDRMESFMYSQGIL